MCGAVVEERKDAQARTGNDRRGERWLERWLERRLDDGRRDDGRVGACRLRHRGGRCIGGVSNSCSCIGGAGDCCTGGICDSSHGVSCRIGYITDGASDRAQDTPTGVPDRPCGVLGSMPNGTITNSRGCVAHGIPNGRIRHRLGDVSDGVANCIGSSCGRTADRLRCACQSFTQAAEETPNGLFAVQLRFRCWFRFRRTAKQPA